VIEQAIVFMVAVSLPLILVVEQITCWRNGLARSRATHGPRRSRRGTLRDVRRLEMWRQREWRVRPNGDAIEDAPDEDVLHQCRNVVEVARSQLEHRAAPTLRLLHCGRRWSRREEATWL
jgi:hypothetical protein